MSPCRAAALLLLHVCDTPHVRMQLRVEKELAEALNDGDSRRRALKNAMDERDELSDRVKKLEEVRALYSIRGHAVPTPLRAPGRIDTGQRGSVRMKCPHIVAQGACKQACAELRKAMGTAWPSAASVYELRFALYTPTRIGGAESVAVQPTYRRNSCESAGLSVHACGPCTCAFV